MRLVWVVALGAGLAGVVFGGLEPQARVVAYWGEGVAAACETPVRYHSRGSRTGLACTGLVLAGSRE
ncbi:hypothetical protein DRB96_21785 [Streptomyces sp. ICC1]|nr:hypothetical protein DRB89_29285 [Streptomyces sp. ICC4]AWZ14460.1 hypothetical protein DRB96_21785 [Streptomyces sp. ICC1]